MWESMLEADRAKFRRLFNRTLEISSDHFIKRDHIHSATLLHRMFQTLAKRRRGIGLHDEYRAQSRCLKFHSAVTCCENYAQIGPARVDVPCELQTGNSREADIRK